MSLRRRVRKEHLRHELHQARAEVEQLQRCVERQARTISVVVEERNRALERLRLAQDDQSRAIAAKHRAEAARARVQEEMGW